ncbi:hypothetical protein TCON_2308 [Astathelohania contejeani]|uniref:Uncharacterized protein n=1 Tax=Astathelohania contejeani TaxID=164912 RepID=A0ABQ7HWC4_9MICR|nr:hypothetical protein TCON_2308 [Thelohania contejeani]
MNKIICIIASTIFGFCALILTVVLIPFLKSNHSIIHNNKTDIFQKNKCDLSQLQITIPDLDNSNQINNHTLTTTANEAAIPQDLSTKYIKTCIISYKDYIIDLERNMKQIPLITPLININEIVKNNNIDEVWIDEELKKRKFINNTILTFLNLFKNIIIDLSSEYFSKGSIIIKDINDTILSYKGDDISQFSKDIHDIEINRNDNSDIINIILEDISFLNNRLNINYGLIEKCYEVLGRLKKNKNKNSKIKESIFLSEVLNTIQIKFPERFCSPTLNIFNTLMKVLNNSKEIFISLDALKKRMDIKNILSINSHVEKINSYECFLDQHRNLIESIKNIFEVSKPCIIDKRISFENNYIDNTEHLSSLKPKALKEYKKLLKLIKDLPITINTNKQETRNAFFISINSLHFVHFIYTKDTSKYYYNNIEIYKIHHIFFDELFKEDAGLTIENFVKLFISTSEF